MNNTLVKIDDEFLLQRHIRCLFEPERYLKYVVSIMFFILNNNTHATGVCMRNIIIFGTNIGSQYVHSAYKVQSASRGPGRW
jgi:hypothetical protein